MKYISKFVTLICVTFLIGGCGIKNMVDSLTPMGEPQAIITLSGMLSETESSEISVEWTRTDPNVAAPNSLTFNNYTYALTYKIPAETIVYGPVKREVIKKLAKLVEAGEAVKISDVTKNGAKIISRTKAKPNAAKAP